MQMIINENVVCVNDAMATDIGRLIYSFQTLDCCLILDRTLCMESEQREDVHRIASAGGSTSEGQSFVSVDVAGEPYDPRESSA